MQAATWREFREVIRAEVGAIPDGIVEDITLTGWQAVLDAIVGQGWPTEFLGDDRVTAPLPSVDEVFTTQEHALLRIWPYPAVQVNVWFFDPDSFEFDVDPRELLGELETESVMGFLRLVGQTAGQQVRIVSEGLPETILVRYDAEADVFQVSG